ncbi:MAG: hypothetical protein JWL75_191 [Parcubacteria group bacterium]|nr:hypothetical protein [Parcubacteria group bacterium]
MKRLFIIIAGIVVIIGVIALVYFVFLAPKSANLTVGDPFSGTGSGTATPSSDLPTDGVVKNAGTTLAPRFVKITDGPVAHGVIALNVRIPVATTDSVTTDTVSLSATSSTSTTTVTTVATTTPDIGVRFIDRASGNVYAYVVHARTLTRISNKTLPGIQQASWTPDGTRAYAQFLATSGGSEQINTYALNATGGDGYLLENGLSEAQVVGSSTLFTLFSGSTGSVGTLSRADGSDSHTLFSSLLSAIIVHPTNRDLFATNRPSSAIDGYAFQINRATGGFSRILGAFPGLSILPNISGSSLVYSFTDSGTYNLRVYDVATHSSTALPVATLSEKCVWAPNGLSIYCAVPTNLSGNLPDDWYQGAVTFTDRIWKIDLTQRVATLILDPNQVGKVNVDAVNLTLDSSEGVLIFTDKHTGALYSYTL